MGTLPGRYIDLVTDGLAHIDQRVDVVRAVRRVMLAAHRHDVDRARIYELLLDTKRRKLARQLATGFQGREIPPSQRVSFLNRHWRETEAVAAERKPWDKSFAIEYANYLQDNLHVAQETLTKRQFAVYQVAVDLARELGTTCPTIPSRTVAERTGIPLPSSNRILHQLVKWGWLRLDHRGNRRTRKANIFTVAPNLLESFRENVWGGYAPYVSSPPTSHQSTSHHQVPGPSESLPQSEPLQDLIEERVMHQLGFLVGNCPDDIDRLLDRLRQRLLETPDSTGAEQVSPRGKDVKDSDRANAPAEVAPLPKVAP